MDNLWAAWRRDFILGPREKGCVFCNRIRKRSDRDNLILYRAKKSVVFMNKYPYNNGHVMIIPYAHESDYTQLPDNIMLDMQRVMVRSLKAIYTSMDPHGMNIGLNLGRTAGAGIDDHLHYHVVPRWNGDTNYMPVLAGTKVISEALDNTWQKLVNAFAEI